MKKWFSKKPLQSQEEKEKVEQHHALNFPLHGVLHIRIIRGIHLQNKDAAGKFLPKFLGKRLEKFVKDVSDPYVVVFADKERLLKS